MPYQSDARIPWMAFHPPLEYRLGPPGAAQSAQGVQGLTPLQQQQLAQRAALFPQQYRQEEEQTKQAALQTEIEYLTWQREMTKMAATLAQGVTEDGSNYPQVRAAILHLMPEAKAQLPEQYDPERVKGLVRQGMTGAETLDSWIAARKYKLDGNAVLGVMTMLGSTPDDDPQTAQQMWGLGVKMAEQWGLDPMFVNAVGREYSPEGKALATRLMQVGQQGGVTKPATTEKPPTLGSFEDYLVRFAREAGKAPETLTPADIELARKKYQQADDRPRVTVTGGGGGVGTYGGTFDPNVVADAIMAGYATPLESGYSRGQWGAVSTSIFKKNPKFPLASAQRDYRAIQQLVRTLNQNQQVKLRQAITKASDSLSILEHRVTDFDGGRWKLVNEARLFAAEQTGGPEQKKAALLRGQINDAIGELAQVLQQGGVPTDEARRMAAENFKAAWQKGTLLAAIQQVRDNMQMALHAIETTGPLGVSADSPYLPPLQTGVTTGGGGGATAPVARPGTRKRYNPRTRKIEEY